MNGFETNNDETVKFSGSLDSIKTRWSSNLVKIGDKAFFTLWFKFTRPTMRIRSLIEKLQFITREKSVIDSIGLVLDKTNLSETNFDILNSTTTIT